MKQLTCAPPSADGSPEEEEESIAPAVGATAKSDRLALSSSEDMIRGAARISETSVGGCGRRGGSRDGSEGASGVGGARRIGVRVGRSRRWGEEGEESGRRRKRGC